MCYWLKGLGVSDKKIDIKQLNISKQKKKRKIQKLEALKNATIFQCPRVNSNIENV